MDKTFSAGGTVAESSAEQDRSLLRRVADGDDAALGVLYDRHGSLTYAMVLRMLGVQEDAEEITADVFSQVWRSARDFDVERGSVGAWIVTIARSRALDKLRARKRAERLVEQATVLDVDVVAVSSALSPAADQRTEQNELTELVTRALGSLPESQRRVIELAYYDGLSQSEIASLLSEPLGTVKTRMRTAMLRLRTSLTPALGAEAT